MPQVTHERSPLLAPPELANLPPLPDEADDDLAELLGGLDLAY